MQHPLRHDQPGAVHQVMDRGVRRAWMSGALHALVLLSCLGPHPARGSSWPCVPLVAGLQGDEPYAVFQAIEAHRRQDAVEALRAPPEETHPREAARFAEMRDGEGEGRRGEPRFLERPARVPRPAPRPQP